MTYYTKHIFFCVNQRDGGRQCCQNADANAMRDYMKRTLKTKGLADPGKIRVNMSGCLGRCAEGPILVVYPEGTWYTYKTQGDINDIIDSHLINGNPVERLMLPQQA